MSNSLIVSLAPLVLDATKREDEIAIQIIDEGMMELALMVKAGTEINKIIREILRGNKII